MMKFSVKSLPRKHLLSAVIILVFFTLSVWVPDTYDLERDLHFKLRGERTVSDKLMLVLITSDDISELGGEWPITRDYYGYLIHILEQMGSRCVGLDIMFTSHDRMHPEYDEILAEFMRSYDKVCLPMTFTDVSETSEGQFTGLDPQYPHEIFKESATGIGFSNLGREHILRRVPLTAVHGEKTIPSFGLELVRIYLGYRNEITIDRNKVILTDSTGRTLPVGLDRDRGFLLNHFGDIEHIPSINLVNLFKTYREKPDTLLFRDKLVIVHVTLPGRTPLINTPQRELIPASIIHATVAENIIGGRLLKSGGWLFSWLLVICFSLLGSILIRKLPVRFIFVVLAGTIAIAFYTGHVIFLIFDYHVPLFYGSLALITLVIAQGTYGFYADRLQEKSQRKLLTDQINKKAEQLASARDQLRQLEGQLSREEVASQKSRDIAQLRTEEIRQLEKELRDLKTYTLPEKFSGKSPAFKDIIHSPASAMVSVLDLVSTVSGDDIPVLIMGETGTGKEMIARTIHDYGPRKNRAFIAVNCGALSETLLESELFGHEKGSFTGAVSRRKGRFELAAGGTIFLDEITETSLGFQAKLLRVLQEGTFERLGSEQTMNIDLRIIAATNKDIQKEQAEGRFRSDLFYRLNGFPVTVPPLRERTEDIPLLSAHFLQKYGPEPVVGFSDRAMELLRKYGWPGNVRELENVVRRAAILAQSKNRDQIREGDLPEELQKISEAEALQRIHQPLEDQILGSLRQMQFSRSSIKLTAEALGNRDRGTITEYFRGLCFEHLVTADFNPCTAARQLALSDNPQIIERVEKKIVEYLSNLKTLLSDNKNPDMRPAYKGLPKKYHPHLKQVIEHLITTETG